MESDGRNAGWWHKSDEQRLHLLLQIKKWGWEGVKESEIQLNGPQSVQDT